MVPDRFTGFTSTGSHLEIGRQHGELCGDIEFVFDPVAIACRRRVQP